MHLESILAVFQAIRHAMSQIRQLAFFPHGDKTGIKFQRQGAADNKPPGLYGHDRIYILVFKLFSQGAYRLFKSRSVF